MSRRGAARDFNPGDPTPDRDRFAAMEKELEGLDEGIQCQTRRRSELVETMTDLWRVIQRDLHDDDGTF